MNVQGSTLRDYLGVLRRRRWIVLLAIVVVPAGDATEFPGMPGTDNVLAIHRAMAQRAALMRTNASDRPNLAAHVTDRDRDAAGQDLRQLARP